MYHLMDLLGKVVTVKNTRGDELVATLVGINEENTVVTLKHAKLVAFSNNQIVLMPYIFTATAETLFVETRNIFTVTETLADAADDYLAMLADNDTDDTADSDTDEA